MQMPFSSKYKTDIRKNEFQYICNLFNKWKKRENSTMAIKYVTPP